MKKTLLAITCIIATSITTFAAGEEPLTFNPANFIEKQLEYPTGRIVTYRSYERIYYVSNVADSVYQTFNIFVPETARESNALPPIFLKTNIGGYMAAKASTPSATDVTGRALLEGYVVVIPGSRGSNSVVVDASGNRVSTGRAPAGIVDLKAAIRYLRHNKALIPGDTERIVTDGTSAGGAMSALLGATGNHPAYEPFLQTLGAADERDDIFAAVCYCPITDLDHADMAYEWLYHPLNDGTRGTTAEQNTVSAELAAMYPAYLNGLRLKDAGGALLTADNYPDYMKSFLLQSARRAREEGIDIPDGTGVKSNDGTVVDIDLAAYLAHIHATRRLKTPPAFDAMGVAGARDTPENKLFGDETGNSVNFTAYSAQTATGNPSTLPDERTRALVHLMNPMNFIGDGTSVTAHHWYIRHGALDRDTSFPVPINLYTKLLNNGCDVNFFLPWNRNHSGDYDPDELFSWIRNVML